MYITVMKNSKRRSTEMSQMTNSDSEIDTECNVSKEKDGVKAPKRKKYYCTFNDNWSKEDEFQNRLVKKICLKDNVDYAKQRFV